VHVLERRTCGESARRVPCTCEHVKREEGEAHVREDVLRGAHVEKALVRGQSGEREREECVESGKGAGQTC